MSSTNGPFKEQVKETCSKLFYCYLVLTSLGVLGVGDGITDNVFQENLIMVTPLAWIAHKLVSSKSPTG